MAVCVRRNYPKERLFSIGLIFLLLGKTIVALAAKETPPNFTELGKHFEDSVFSQMQKYCLDCHSTEKQKGELDLEQFAKLSDVRRAPKVWVKVVEMMTNGEMPPKKKPQFSAVERKVFLGWVNNYLDAEALANAGDPGRVVLRRLSNAEYTYTIEDLTGVALEPVKEFPVDGAAGEGFMNVGDAMVMSPALVQKYLDAAKDVATHAVLTPEGVRFSLGKSRRDWVDELIYEIRSIYDRHTSGAGATDKIYAWDPNALDRAMNTSGRVDLVPYFNALVMNRDRFLKKPASTLQVARESGLNEKYLKRLANLLVTENPSLLLRRLRDDLRTAKSVDAKRIANDVSQWQERLWDFGKVGQIGRQGVQDAWMNPVAPLEKQQELKLKIPEIAKGEISVFLMTGDAGDGSVGDHARWINPRLIMKGQPAIPLGAVNNLAERMTKLQLAELARTEQYLNLIAEAELGGMPIEVVAKERGLDEHLLEKWVTAVQLGKFATSKPAGHYPGKLFKAGGYDAIRGWGTPATPSLIANKSPETIRFGTLTVPGRSVNMHPSPTQEAIIYWQSPIEGRVKLKGYFADSDGVGGNGAAWRVELLGRTGTGTVDKGVFENGKRGTFTPEQEYIVERGDLLKLVVNARDRNHGYDTTEVALNVIEQGGKKRVWDLAKEVVDRVHDSNPLADSFGNKAVWHFCSSGSAKSAQSEVPVGSALANWRSAVIGKKPVTEIRKHASVVHRLLISGDYAVLAADKVLREHFLEPKGPLKWLSLTMGDTEVKDIETKAPSVLEFKLPTVLVAGAEVVVNAELHPEKGKDGTAQFLISLEKNSQNALTGQAVVTGTAASKRMEKAYADFRELFPAAMCYPQIVPVDEVVTMVLYHREDEPLRRLMLSDAEASRLDRLWNELLFVSREPLLRVVSHEQLYEFATQDRKDLLPALEALRMPIQKTAETFLAHLKKTAPIHFSAVLELAESAWRRPLSDADRKELHDLYQTLLQKELKHDRAIRLVLARVLTSPAFLYRLEQPATAKGRKWVSVSNLELANRLSYFLWSSMPDDELMGITKVKIPVNKKAVSAQAKRMLGDPRIKRLAVEFACQWLGIREFDLDNGKNERLYPQFANLRGSMYEESVRFFEELFRNDGSILDLLNADHAFLNESLAKHYGIPGVSGAQWRRVENTRAMGRGGILAMGAILAKQSGASRTSPILRGNWISETLLGEHLPKPPVNVPDLPETVPVGLTARQLIEKHSSVAACAKCHAKIDPYGFALEQYDAIGRLRSKAVDTKTKLMDGNSIDGLTGLREYLLNERREEVVRQFCKKLLGYALGREVALSDRPLLKSMQEQLAKNDFRFSIAVEAIVTSEQFRSIRTVVVKVD